MKKRNSYRQQQLLTQKLLAKVGYKKPEKRDPKEWAIEYSASLKTQSDIVTSDTIPANGTKRDASGFIQEAAKYPKGVAYNKGPIMVLSRDEIKHAGKK